MNQSLHESGLAPARSERVEISSANHGALGSQRIEDDYRIELVRKSIHLFSLLIPLVYSFISRSAALSILLPLTTAFLIVDIARYYHQPTAVWFYSTFGWLLRSKEQNTERKRLNGATNVLLSATLCVLIFPKLITITAFSILIISDSVAALVGRKFGKRPFFRKTVEGSVAFFLGAVCVVLVAPKAGNSLGEYFIGIFASGVGTLVEAISIDIDDNISIPISIAIAMWLLYLVFYPSLEISKITFSF